MNASGRSSRRSCTIRVNWWNRIPLPARKRGASSDVHTVVSPRASWIVSASVRTEPPSVTCASQSQVWSRSATAFT